MSKLEGTAVVSRGKSFTSAMDNAVNPNIEAPQGQIKTNPIPHVVIYFVCLYVYTKATQSSIAP